MRMISINEARSARVADVDGGHLVAYRHGHTFELGVILSGAKPPQKGVLLFGSKQSMQHQISNHYCLDLGRPTFRWKLDETSISDATHRAPDAGHLIAQNGSILIAGLAMDRNLFSTICAWRLADGEMANLDPQSAIFLTKWEVGVIDAGGRFQRVFRFPPPI